MPFIHKAVGWLLLVALTIAPMAAQVMSEVPVPHQPPAGCHEHQDRNSSPQPTSYACCKSGHHVALLPERFTLRSFWLPASEVIESATPSIGTSVDRVCWQLFPGDSPPALLPLRI